MLYGIVFIITFIIGFAFGIAMPFILKKLDIYKEPETIEFKKNMSVDNSSSKIIDEWLNGKRGE